MVDVNGLRAAALVALVMLAGSAVADPLPRPVPTLEICRGGDRAARGLTCVVDGDTFYRLGRKYRLACVDAAELGERHGPAARHLLARLLADPAARVIPAGRTGRYGRDLARVVATGGDAGRVLVEAGLARRVAYRSTRDFCRRAGW